CARFEFSDKDIKDLKGTISGHAYSILRTAETDDGIKLLQIRNPWGTAEWNGAWSDGSKEWTPERMIQLNHRFGDDGTFWMCYDDFLNYWDMIDKCRLFDSRKFKLSLPEECHLIIVLQQPDDRYFCNEPKYDYQLSFHVFKDGETSSYLARSRSTFAFASRSINHEVKLPAGDYVIIPHEDQEPKKEKDSEIEAKKHEWELQLGLRVYSKYAGIKLEGLPEEKAEEKDPEVDTKDDEKKDDEKKDDEKKDK
ncbi:15808_t:CDS:2, partial [Racocetra fulgida]